MAAAKAPARQKSIVFFHPDLGIGGAERLVIDAAVGLQALGHRVTIFTSHCDPAHCFDEARDGEPAPPPSRAPPSLFAHPLVAAGTLDVRVRGALLPATVFGRLKILFAVLRQLHLILQISLSGELAALSPSAFFIDQLSAGIPLLRLLRPGVRILFYCHFPDLLLVQQRKSLLKRIWRVPFDWLEGWSMRGADRVVVNSEFTRSVVRSVWGESLGGKEGIGVVYPCVPTKQGRERARDNNLWGGKKVVLSINRFERKKDIGLAIRGYAGLPADVQREAKMVVAGRCRPCPRLAASRSSIEGAMTAASRRTRPIMPNWFQRPRSLASPRLRQRTW
jgi:alpha-1,3/alpha-1,6-mannosyltransferase